ncbi:MAG TPA: GAF domain-containing protein, partial [Stellaceae bacterium]|nr:GAF domain-containing protein [Stellaceae bacterium]
MATASDDRISELEAENASLRRQLAEALDQQTATAEVLEVINASPGDLDPVFDAMLEKAMRLCDASFGVMAVVENGALLFRAQRNIPRAFFEFVRRPVAIDRDTFVGQAVLDRTVIQAVDILAEQPYRRGVPLAVAAAEAGVRTMVYLPLVKDDTVLGVFTIYRTEVRPFTDKQIALLGNFAAQAVIAMENARLITETREALDQQTATAEVLSVINSSPGDLAPVFDAMLEKALHLCEATHGQVWRLQSGEMHAVAVHGDPGFSDWIGRQGPIRPIPGSAAHRIAEGEISVHLTDRREEEAYRTDPLFRELVDTSDVRASLSVPLRKDDGLLGMINVYRQEVRPFSEKQIALLENFAAQAVVAMENARLLTETREALDQQTATAEVLQVINASPGSLAPVFDAMLEKATRLCDATFGQLATYDGEFFRFVAKHGRAPFLRQHPTGPLRPSDGVTWQRLVAGAALIHIPDVSDTDLYRSGHEAARAFVEIGGGRTLLTVALRKDGTLLGALTVYRREVRPFSDKQIALLGNFAAQAVIAMENARLITETQEALDQQTATTEVLQVINSSPGELTPVFDAMLEKAMRLCEATFGQLSIYDGQRFDTAVTRGVSPAFAEYRRRNPPAYGPNTQPLRLLAGERVIHDADLKASALYEKGDQNRRALVDLGGARSSLMVALARDEQVLGFVHIYRQEVRAFSDKQIALLQNFAAQAVIAMENARLITETQEALDQQTATAEVLRVISSTETDLEPVFAAIVERASNLCEAEFSAVARVEDGLLHLVAVTNLSEGEAAAFHSLFPREPNRGFIMGRAFVDGRPVHVEDVLADPAYDHETRRILQTQTGYRTFLGVPLLRDGESIGVIGCGRRAVKAFGEGQIELVQTFADQAVIAIENARLLTETREARDAAEGALRDLKAAQGRLIQAEKMASLGQLTA